MFYMGVDSKIVKAPFIWHDILDVLDVLSKYEWLMDNSRLTEMADIVKLKADNERSAHSNQCGKHGKIRILPKNSLHNS